MPSWTSHTSGALVSPIVQRCGVTVAIAVAVTASVPFGPVVPDAFAVFVSTPVVLIERVFDSDWLAPGASGPQLPTVKSSPVFPGVPASSTSVPEAAKKSPLFVTL